MVRLANWLQDRGWPVLMYLLPDSKMAADATARGLTLRPIKGNRRYLDLSAAWSISKAFTKDEVDVVWLRDPRDLSVAGIAKGFGRGRIKLIYQQGMQLGSSRRDLIHTLRYTKMDAWLVSLETLAAQLKQKTRYPHDRIHIVPLGLELEKFTQPSLSKLEARKKLDLPETALIIGNIGRFGKMKQQDLLIRGLQQLRDQGNDCHLLLVGASTINEGDAFINSLHSLIKELKLSAYVHFRPYMENVGVFYQSIDIFALASKKETYGMVTIEAMASGLPIVATNSGGTIEILKSGKLGMLYDPSSAQDFALKTESLLKDPEKMQLLRALTQNEAIEYYSNEKECQRIAKIINTL